MAIHISHLSHVDHRAEIGDDVFIGPFCVVGPNVTIGDGTRLDSNVVIEGHTTVGRNNRFFPNSVIGAEPQDYSYSGAPTRVEIGDGNTFREGVTVNRGAEKEDHVTRIGNQNMLMSNAHVAHNCHVYDNVVLVNGVLLGGHVHVHDWAIISGNTVVHHFSTVGTLAFISGGCRVTTDVPPYLLASGNEHPKMATVNLVGLQRRGFSKELIGHIKQVHRLLYREFKSLPEVRAHFETTLSGHIPPELTHLFDFIELQRSGRNGRGGEARRSAPSVPADATVAQPLRRAA